MTYTSYVLEGGQWQSTLRPRPKFEAGARNVEFEKLMLSFPKERQREAAKKLGHGEK
jgi:hypothetical protein